MVHGLSSEARRPAKQQRLSALFPDARKASFAEQNLHHLRATICMAPQMGRMLCRASLSFCALPARASPKSKVTPSPAAHFSGERAAGRSQSPYDAGSLIQIRTARICCLP